MTTQAQTITTMFGTFDLEDVKAGRASIVLDDSQPTPTMTQRIKNAVTDLFGKNKEESVGEVRKKLDDKAIKELKKVGSAQRKEINTLIESNGILRERLGVMEKENKGLKSKVEKLRIEGANNKTPAELQQELDTLKKQRFEQMMRPVEAFEEAYTRVEEVVEFDERAHNGTGYLDGLVYLDLGLKPGQCVKTQDEHGRKVLIQGSSWGNIVVFQRYQPDDNGYSPIVSNAPDQVTSLLSLTTSLTYEVITTIFALVEENNWGAVADRLLVSEARIAYLSSQENKDI